MNEFERNLRDALSRRDPPEGFADRVLAEAANSGRQPHRPSWGGWAAAAAAVLILTAGLFMDTGRMERARVEQAKQELLLALRVTGTTLGQVEERVLRAQPVRVVSPRNN